MISTCKQMTYVKHNTHLQYVQYMKCKIVIIIRFPKTRMGYNRNILNPNNAVHIGHGSTQIVVSTSQILEGEGDSYVFGNGTQPNESNSTFILTAFLTITVTSS